MEVLSKMVDIIATFVESFMALSVLMHIFKGKGESSATITVIAIMITPFFSLFNWWSVSSPYVTILAIVSWSVIVYLCTRKNYLPILAISTLFIMIVALMDLIASFIAITIFDVSVGEIAYQQSQYRIFVLIISKVLLVVAGKFILEIMGEQKGMPKRYLFLGSSISLTSVLLIFLVIHCIEQKKYSPLILIYAIIMVTITFLMFKLLTTLKDYYETQKHSELIQLSNEMLDKSLRDTEHSIKLWRRNIHDYKNHIIYLDRLTKEEKWEELREYLAERMELAQHSMLYIRTGNDMVDTIVNLKKQQAEENQICFTINGKIPEQVTISDIHLTSLFGNLLDNALEAEEKEENPYISVNFSHKGDVFILKIVNKYTGTWTGKLKKSSKKNPEYHGIGRSIVTDIIEEYKGVIHTSCCEEECVVLAQIPIK